VPALRKILLVSFLFFCSCPPASAEKAKAKTQWKSYFNERWGFCAAYPAEWRIDEGFNKAGIFAAPRPQSRPHPSPAHSGLEIGARVNQPSKLDESRQQTLDEIFTDILRSRGSGVQILERHDENFQGFPAIRAKIHWQSYEPWVAENLTVLTTEGIVYSVGMRFRLSELRDFEPVFTEIVERRFKIKCK